MLDQDSQEAAVTEQVRQQEYANQLLDRSTPSYAQHYQQWSQCMQQTDDQIQCGQEILPPINSIQSNSNQIQQTQSQLNQPQRTQSQPDQVQQVNTVSSPGGAVAIISTKFGEINIQLLDNVAPKTVANFEKLANSGYYDGTIFHRIVPGFVIQGGDPNTKSGSRDTWGIGDAGYTIPPEFSSMNFIKYTVGMARGSDVNSGSSQFFITVGDASFLNGKYTLFGQVISGQDVVDKIALLQTDSTTNQPVNPDDASINKIIIQNHLP
jgi:dolichyl-diphosphooligosaccharide--protein glycosyltransferase